MADVTGTLRDIGLESLNPLNPVLVFKPQQNAVTPGGSLFATKPVEVVPLNTGAWTADLAPTLDLRPPTWWTLSIKWRNPSGYDADHGFTSIDFPDWKIYVPAEGGSIADIMRASGANPMLWWVSSTAPVNPEPGTYWLNPGTGDVRKWS